MNALKYILTYLINNINTWHSCSLFRLLICLFRSNKHILNENFCFVKESKCMPRRNKSQVIKFLAGLTFKLDTHYDHENNRYPPARRE